MSAIDINSEPSTGNVEAITAMRMVTVHLVPRASYVPGGDAAATAAAKDIVVLEVPCSLTVRDVGAELLRATHSPTVAQRVREWLGVRAAARADASSAGAPAVHMYVEERCADSAELVPVAPLLRLDELVPSAANSHPLSPMDLTLYHSAENRYGDEEDLCLVCCALCACCAACCAASSAVNAANSANKPAQAQPAVQPAAPPNPQGPYNYAGYNGNENAYLAQPQNAGGMYYNPQQGYGAPAYGSPAYGGNYVAQQPNQYGVPPAQAVAAPGQPVPTAMGGGYPVSLYNNTSGGGVPNAQRTGSVGPEEVVFSARPPASTPASAPVGPVPEFSPAEGRSELEYPSERPPAAASDSGLPPPQYKLSGFDDNENDGFDAAKKPGK